MLTLVQAKKLIQDEVQAGVVYSTYLQNPLVASLPFENILGDAKIINRANGIGTVASTRAINGDYTEETVDSTRFTFGLGRIGGLAKVDNYIQTVGSDKTDQLGNQITAKAKATAVAFQNMFFNGDVAVDANGFDGLKKLLAGTSQNTEDPTVMITLADLDALVMSLDGDASALIMNDKTLLKVNGLAKNTGMLAFSDLNDVGTRITTYGGVDIYRAGKVGAGTQILADGEVYAVRFGPDGVYGIQRSTPAAEVFPPNAQSPSWTARIDWFAGIAQESLQSAARITKKIV